MGLGNIGTHYAARFLKSSEKLYVRDRNPSKIEPLAAAGAEAVQSSRDLTRASDTIVLALPDPDAVKEEMLGPLGVLAAERKGCLVIDSSTIDPETSRHLHAEARLKGHDYVEAPMSGGEPGGAGQLGAEAGTITFMVGGDDLAVERARPVLETLGRHVIHVGPAGTGNTVKLISNLIAGLNMAVMAEGFVLGAAAGISHELLLEVFRHTDAKSYTMFEEFAPHFCAYEYEGGFPVDLMHKDHRLAGELARKYGVPLLFNQLGLVVYQICRSKGLGRKSHAVVAEVLAELAGVEFFDRGK